jgi:hypothetical protein
LAIKNHMGDEEFRKACSSRGKINIFIYTSVCIYVYMYVSAYMHKQINTYVTIMKNHMGMRNLGRLVQAAVRLISMTPLTYICVYLNIYIYMCINIYICIFKYTYISRWTGLTPLTALLHISIYTYTYVYLCIYIYTCIHICIYNIHICIYTPLFLLDGTGLTPLTTLLHIIKAQASHSRNIENRQIPSNTLPNALLHIKMSSSYITQILEILLQNQIFLNPIPHGLTPTTPEYLLFGIRYDNLKNRLQNIESRLHILITLYQPPKLFKPTPRSQKNSIRSQVTQDTDSSHINKISYPNDNIPSIILSDLSSMIIQMEGSEQFQKVHAILSTSQKQWMTIKKSFFTLPSLR